MRVLLVEPYYDGSHRAWADGYLEHSAHDVRLISHPGRWWKWRMRGAAVTLAAALRDLDGWQPNVVMASDMVDLAHFRALARPFIGEAPVALYFHESQLTYPDPPGVPADDSYALTNWISAYSADWVFFNSGYHRDNFFESLPDLLRRFPDHRHDHLIAEVVTRSEVLPVGVDLAWLPKRSHRSGPPRILWNHRWEHDKDPDVFAEAIERLVDMGRPFELVLLGPRSNKTPPALDRIRHIAGKRIIHDGAPPTAAYRKLVAESDIVVSTARQEFFGVSVVEAIATGCRPVLPNRLSYPWLIPEQHHERVLYQEDRLLPALVDALADPSAPEELAETMHRFSWEKMAPLYDDHLEVLARPGFHQ